MLRGRFALVIGVPSNPGAAAQWSGYPYSPQAARGRASAIMGARFPKDEQPMPPGTPGRGVPAMPAGFRLIKSALNALARLYFREVAVVGREIVPFDRGGIIVSWHPNGLV